jgi:curved DNA-binding protein CbpA
VKAAYRTQVKQVHPDHGGSHEEFLALQAAYEAVLRLCRYHP